VVRVKVGVMFTVRDVLELRFWLRIRVCTACSQ